MGCLGEDAAGLDGVADAPQQLRLRLAAARARTAPSRRRESINASFVDLYFLLAAAARTPLCASLRRTRGLVCVGGTLSII